MVIRAFMPEDKDCYLAMGRDFYAGEGTLFPISDQKLLDTFDCLMRGEPGLRGCILEHEGQVVGYALLVFYWSCEAGGQTVQLEELYLSERVRAAAGWARSLWNGCCGNTRAVQSGFAWRFARVTNALKSYMSAMALKFCPMSRWCLKRTDEG